MASMSAVGNLLQFRPSHDTILTAPGDRFSLTRDTDVQLSAAAVLSPCAPPEEPLFDQGHSKWTLELRIRRLGVSNQTFKTYRSPHDLWRLLRSEIAYAWSSQRAANLISNKGLIAENLHFCAAGDRSTYVMQLEDADRTCRLIRVLDKNGGFLINLYALGETLLWRCFGGAPGSVEAIDEGAPVKFGDGFVFECSVYQLLGLPAYEPDALDYTGWRRLTML